MCQHVTLNSRAATKQSSASVVKPICRQGCPATLTVGVEQLRKKPDDRSEYARFDGHAIIVSAAALAES